MNTKRNLIIATVLCIIISSITQWYLFFTGISNIDFLTLQILTFLIDGFLLLAVLFIVGFILLKKGTVNEKPIKKSAIIITAIYFLSGIGLTTYGYFACYNLYTPESQLENPDATVEELFPYHDIKECSNYDLEVSHNLFEDYIGVHCNGVSESGEVMVYRMDYFESLSPLMNAYYSSGKALKTPFSDPFETDVDAEGKTMTIGGKDVTIYVSNEDYAVLISDFNSTVYASLTGRTKGVTEKGFAEEVLKQSGLIEAAVASDRFLDAD